MKQVESAKGQVPVSAIEGFCWRAKALNNLTLFKTQVSKVKYFLSFSKWTQQMNKYQLLLGIKTPNDKNLFQNTCQNS